MKRIFKKVLICILVLFTLNNFFAGCIPNNFMMTSYAASDPIMDKLTDLMGAVVGLLTLPLRIVAMGVGLAVNKLTAGVAYIENDDTNTPDSEWSEASISPEEILFNDVAVVDINFFEIDGLSEDSLLYKFRTAIALWYYAMRIIASAILLVVLVYVGIRMGLSTVSAEQKASYKRMIVDWVVSVAIIFVMQYIMLFTIYVNDAIVGAIEEINDSENVQMAESIDKIGEMALEPLNIEGIAATVIYCMLVFQTLGLFIAYFNRMLKLAFLTIISPLITITYSIDKIGDRKSQVLNTWLKEYVFTILIQPFHCIIYMAFVQIALEMLSGRTNKGALACSVIAILCIKFIKTAEDIVRKIFAFEDDNKDTSLGAGLAIATVAASKGKSIGKSTRKAINGAGNAVRSIKSGVNNSVVEAIAVSRMIGGKNVDKETGKVQTLEEVKSDVRSERLEKKASKLEKKRYGVSKDNANSAEEIEKRANNLIASGMREREAKAYARAAVAKEKRDSDKKKNSKFRNNRVISRAVGVINTARTAVRQSETLKELGGVARAYIGAGVGLGFGSGYYGATGKAMEAIMTGVATAQGTTEFLATTDRTLRNDVNARLQSLGVTSKAGVAEMTNGILANGSKFEGTDELDKIKDEIKKALERAGVDSSKATNIQHSIQQAFAKSPSRNINDVVNDSLIANQINGAQLTPDLVKATTKFADFNQKREIYNSFKNAGDIGTSADTFMEKIISSYIPAAAVGGAVGAAMGTSVRERSQEFLKDAKDITSNVDGKEEKFVAPDDQAVREFIKDMNEETLKEFYKTCKQETRRIQKELSDTGLSDAEREALIAEMNQIEAARAKVVDMAFDRAVEEVRKEYQDLLDKATHDTEGEAKRVVEQQLSELQSQYDRYIKEAENQIGRKEMDGIKSDTQIIAQKLALETEKKNIEDTINNLRKS